MSIYSNSGNFAKTAHPSAEPFQLRFIEGELSGQLREAILSAARARRENHRKALGSRIRRCAGLRARGFDILITQGFEPKARRSARVLRLTDAASFIPYSPRGARGLGGAHHRRAKTVDYGLRSRHGELRLAVEANDVRSVIDRVQRFMFVI